MNILVSGTAGFIGSSLVPLLSSKNHGVLRLVRLEPRHHKDEVVWDPVHGQIRAQDLNAVDAVIHLAGENVANGRWTAEKKSRIRNSRLEGTRLLAETMASMSKPPKTFICASATGFYGDRGDTPLDELSGPGTGFLAKLCQDWEEACEPARKKGIRVVNLRIGIVVSAEGGALRKMLPPFRMGLGGRLGHGFQFMSWIALPDLQNIFLKVLADSTLSGPVNAVAPHPVNNREWTRTLGRVLGKPTFLNMPAFAARLLLGEMANELLLASACVQPKRLLDAGFVFAHPTLEEAIRNSLYE